MFYDPLGVLQPIWISLKLLFQNLHKEKFEWDESISLFLDGVTATPKKTLLIY